MKVWHRIFDFALPAKATPDGEQEANGFPSYSKACLDLALVSQLFLSCIIPDRLYEDISLLKAPALWNHRFSTGTAEGKNVVKLLSLARTILNKPDVCSSVKQLTFTLEQDFASISSQGSAQMHTIF